MWTPIRVLAVLLPSAAALRFVLAIRGGQFFDWDEHRYGFSTLMFERLRAGDLGGVLDILSRYPEHPGFKIFGLGPAALQQALHPGQPISDMRQATGEWLTAFVFSLSSVCAIGLTYAVGRRAGASEREPVRRLPDVRVDVHAHARASLFPTTWRSPLDCWPHGSRSVLLTAWWTASARACSPARLLDLLRLLAACGRCAGRACPLASFVTCRPRAAACRWCRRIRDRAGPADRGQQPPQPPALAVVAAVRRHNYAWRVRRGLVVAVGVLLAG